MSKRKTADPAIKILSLEDEPRDAELIREIMEDSGTKFEIKTVSNKNDFIAALENGDYHVFLADYKLPGFNASDALRIAKKYHPDVPFICVSGTMGEDVAVDLLKQGATDYILKDRMQRLPSAIQRALVQAGEHKARHEAEDALLESEKRFRSLVENAFDAIYLIHNRHLEYVNPRFCEMTGYSDSELKSESFNIEYLFTEESYKLVEKRYKDRIDGAKIPSQYETQIKTKSGKVLDVEFSTVSLGTPGDVKILGMIHDLTRRKQAEQALLRAHKLLKETQSISKIGGWDYDVATGITSWTNEVYSIYGVGKEYIPDKTGSDMTFFTPECREICEKVFWNTINKGESYNLELELIKANGEHIWVRSEGKPILKDGRVIRVSGYIRDITERRLQRKKLEELSSRQEAILSAVPDIIMEVDNNKTYTWVNRAGIEFFGDDVIGKEAAVYYEDDTDVYGYMKPLFDGEEETLYVENWQRRRDGEKRLLAWWCRGLRDAEGQIIGALFSARDITESRKSEELIAHLNRVLLSIRDVNKLITSEKDAEAIIRQTCSILVNRRGYAEVMIVLVDDEGKPKLWAEKGMEGAFSLIEKKLRSGIPPPCCDEKIYNGDIKILEDRNKYCAECAAVKDFIHNKAMCTRIKYHDTIYGFLGVSLARNQEIDEEEQALFIELANDVAFALYNLKQMEAKRQAEAERDKIEAQLRQSQKMEAVGQLAGGVAHDFNNMLTVIMGYTDLALAKVSVDDPLYRNFIEIQAASLRSTNIIRQLLAFSRKQLIAPEPSMLNELITDLLRMLGRLIGEDIELKFLPSGDLWNIWIDPTQVSQILTNLAVNARDAITNVGSVTIETSNVVLDETYRKVFSYVIPGEYVLLSFSDTGHGIDSAIKDRIFEPFFTTKESGKGTGLGLSTVYGIVKQNNGYIHVYSELNMGTTFKIYFPRFYGEKETAVEKIRKVVMEGTETILIVEDYEEILYLAMEILENYGYKVLSARNPEEAVMKSEQYKDKIHLLITDVIMPSMNGRDLDDRIKISRPDIKTLFMSGYTADIIAQRGVIDQGVAFLQKPFSVESLIIKVRSVLDL